MIVDLPDTTTSAVSKKLIQLRNDVGAMALGRVLTLVIVVNDQLVETALENASNASRQHPCRIVTVVRGDRRGRNRIDAQIRVGGDAGASEIVVLRLHGPLAGHAESVVTPLLLADSPVVAWWPGDAPRDVHEDPIGRMANRRITDAAQERSIKTALRQRALSYEPGDTDLAWGRLTRWRSVLAAALDQPPFEPVTSAVVAGASDSPSADLLAAWLQRRLKCPVSRVRTAAGTGVSSVRLDRPSGPIDLVRPGDAVATLTQGGQPDRRIALARRRTPEVLADELRRLDADEVYADVLRHGVGTLSPARQTQAAAVKQGRAPSVAEARKLARRLSRRATIGAPGSMVTALPSEGDTPVVEQATRKRLAGKPTSREQQLRKAAKTAAAKKPAAQRTQKSSAKKTSRKNS